MLDVLKTIGIGFFLIVVIASLIAATLMAALFVGSAINLALISLGEVTTILAAVAILGIAYGVGTWGRKNL